MVKLFHKPSAEHGGMVTGTKVRLIIDHSEIDGRISAGSECVINAIIHFPTRYRLQDDDDNIWTVPIHSVELVTAEASQVGEEENGEAGHGG